MRRDELTACRDKIRADQKKYNKKRLSRTHLFFQEYPGQKDAKYDRRFYKKPIVYRRGILEAIKHKKGRQSGTDNTDHCHFRHRFLAYLSEAVPFEDNDVHKKKNSGPKERLIRKRKRFYPPIDSYFTYDRLQRPRKRKKRDVDESFPFIHIPSCTSFLLQLSLHDLELVLGFLEFCAIK
jgi:hypothetical protein